MTNGNIRKALTKIESYFMKSILKNSIFILALCFILSCNKKNSDNEDNLNLTENENMKFEENQSEESNTFNSSTSDCGFDDSSYSTTVDYNNPETGYSATYTLDVDVEDCQVIQIYFPNDGYLDEDHISAADLDENGNASVYGEEGKTYEITIDN